MKQDTIHINCDLGEGGEYDEQLMPLISACNIACGGHAGTVETMQKTVALALENNVEIGAHPSYPDKENFGRKNLQIEPGKLKQSIVAQILSLKQVVESEGGKLNHVKPHGALYNEAARDPDIAQIVIDAMLEFDQKMLLYAPPRSVISQLAEGKIKVAYEAFADRNYNEDYSLVSRQKPDALIVQKEGVFDHLYMMYSEKKISCASGGKIACSATTYCLHGDTPNSVEILQYLNAKLAEKNIRIYKA